MPALPAPTPAPAQFASAEQARASARAFELKKIGPDFIANPYPVYNALREHQPVARMPDGSYFVSRYDDCIAVYKDAKLFSSDKQAEFRPKFGDGLLYEHHTTSLIFNDPPLHTRVRKIIAGA
jgi:cytochrome P450